LISTCKMQALSIFFKMEYLLRLEKRQKGLRSP
jgi:hypothetical protein